MHYEKNIDQVLKKIIVIYYYNDAKSDVSVFDWMRGWNGKRRELFAKSDDKPKTLLVISLKINCKSATTCQKFNKYIWKKQGVVTFLCIMWRTKTDYNILNHSCKTYCGFNTLLKPKYIGCYACWFGQFFFKQSIAKVITLINEK